MDGIHGADFSTAQPEHAPTRLLDWTYSPYVAAKFAIEGGGKDSVLWCVNSDWENQAAIDVVGKMLKDRSVDKSRNDCSFKPLYMNGENRLTFVSPENPFHMNERLIIQQGLFMCPGNISIPFSDNLKNMSGWSQENNIVKILFKMNPTQTREFAMTLGRMNVNSAVLFPGLDGFASSLREHLFRYEDLAKTRTGMASSQPGK